MGAGGPPEIDRCAQCAQAQPDRLRSTVARRTINQSDRSTGTFGFLLVSVDRPIDGRTGPVDRAGDLFSCSDSDFVFDLESNPIVVS